MARNAIIYQVQFYSEITKKGTHFRGLFPEGLKKGVSIQHKFEDGEVVTRAKAENGLTKAVS